MLNYSWINRILFFCAICLSGIMSTKAQETYLDVIINYTPTNFHYGDLNGDLKSYKDSKSGLQAGIAYQKGITPHFSVVPELYFMMKGGALQHGSSGLLESEPFY
jgi:hypothetical protein